MKIYLRDTNRDLVDMWKKYFRNTDVHVSLGNIFDLKADAIVSPSNSFGIMDGGIDLLYKNKFGVGVENNVKQIIKVQHNGELLVGQAIVVPTHNENTPSMIVAPTMYIPFKTDDTPNAYLAFKAALLKAKELSLNSILCPGFCTGTGRMCLEMSTRQMFTAYINIIKEKMPTQLDHLWKQYFWMLRCSQVKVPNSK